MAKQRYTKAQVEAALVETKGTIRLAARRLGLTPRSLLNYLERYPELRETISDLKQELVDFAELELWRAVQASEHWAIVYVLNTQGRDRGYGKQVDLKHSGSIGGKIDFGQDFSGAIMNDPEAAKLASDLLERLDMVHTTRAESVADILKERGQGLN